MASRAGKTCTEAGCPRPARKGRAKCNTHGSGPVRARSRNKKGARHIYACLSPAEWTALYEAQGGKCAIGGEKLVHRYLDYAAGDDEQTAYLDHSHAAEKAARALGMDETLALRSSVRGLLCYWCNREILHALRDNAQTAHMAGFYLDSPPALKVIRAGN